MLRVLYNLELSAAKTGVTEFSYILPLSSPQLKTGWTPLASFDKNASLATSADFKKVYVFGYEAQDIQQLSQILRLLPSVHPVFCSGNA
jgi:hypothetical protein